jgi:hypothetical protein
MSRWARLPKYRANPILAPPTIHSTKDGSFYRPPIDSSSNSLITNGNGIAKRKPKVPEAARIKSAKRLIQGIEQKRLQNQKTNSFMISTLIERLPIIQRPMTSWELDMNAVQSLKYDEIESKIPPSIIKPNYEENPQWAVDSFKQIYRARAETLLPLVSPPKVSIGSEQKNTADNTVAGGNVGKKQKKEKKAAPPAATATEASKPDGKATGTTTTTPPTAATTTNTATTGNESWRKTFADMGIEFAETKAEDQQAFKMHVQLKQKQDDKQAFFQPADRITEADRTNDKKSLDRKLYEKLYLVVKRNGKWGFPSVKPTEKEGLLSAAQRAAWTVFDRNSRESDLFFISACPMGYRPVSGIKEFFLRAQLIHGGFDAKLIPQPIEDFAWLSPVEICDLLVGKNDADEYFYMKRMFADDWWEDADDSDELSPIDDELSRQKVKSIDRKKQIERIQQEVLRRKQLRAKLAEARQSRQAKAA